MLYYVAIYKSEGLDWSEGQDCVRNIALKSRQFTSCRFIFALEIITDMKKQSVMDVFKV